VKRITLLFGLAIVLGFSAGAAKEVFAHSISNEGITYYSSNSNCTWARSRIDHGSGGGYSYSDVVSRAYAYVACADWFQRPAGYISNQFQLYYHNGSTWQLCAWSDTHYNPTPSISYSIAHDYGGSPPCGNGYYANHALGRVNVNGTWYGDWLWAGSHWFP
jgi:hypothetical protein